MMADFDIAAVEYDSDFTHSPIGRLQRERVWKFLNEALQKKEGLKILELNCGTGEDAIMLAEQGNQVVATDVSGKMLEVAASKYKGDNIAFELLDLNAIDESSLQGEFDLVFSNFGGLNCIDYAALQRLGDVIPGLLKTDGKFIAVVMPQACLWETFYYLVKGKLKEAFRRSRSHVFANVSGLKVKTWYYSPQRFERAVAAKLKRERLKPVGLFIPPSYLTPFFTNKPRLLRLFKLLESRLGFLSWEAAFSDHYYIQYKVR